MQILEEYPNFPDVRSARRTVEKIHSEESHYYRKNGYSVTPV